MRIAPENSINRRLTLTMVATTAVALFAACTAFVLYDAVSLRRTMLRDTATLAEVIGINSAVALSFRDRRAAEETLSALTGAERVVGAAIYGEDGEVFAMYDAFRELGQPFSPPVAAEAEQRFEAGYLHLSRPIVVEGEAIGTIYLRIETAELRTRLQRYAGIVVCLLAAVAGLGLFISTRLRRQITLPLSQLAEGSQAIAEGLLSTQVHVSARNEIGSLAITFNEMANSLKQLVSQVHHGIGDVTEVTRTLQESGGSLTYAAHRQEVAISEAAESIEFVGRSIVEVNSHGEQLAESVQETSRSIVQMDASIGEIAGHMEELSQAIEITSRSVQELAPNINQVVKGMETLNTATDGTEFRLHQLRQSVTEVRGNAEQTHALSNDASQEAARGVEAVEETIASMQEIWKSFNRLKDTVARLSAKSQSIDAILQVIGGVAEQTNLLALNAAIIAAQAGEQGRAFSVVADEVRSLADRTAHSTRQISELIRGVQEETATAVDAAAEGSEKVERGVQRSNEAGDVLQRIIEKSQTSTGRAQEIAEATGRQTGHLERVDQAMQEVKEIVVQINRSMQEQQRASEEIAASTEQVRELGQSVSRSTVEQRRESELITASVRIVMAMINQIVDAMQEQRSRSETIQQALTVFREVTTETTRRASAINEMVELLSNRSRQLESEIGSFQIE